MFMINRSFLSVILLWGWGLLAPLTVWGETVTPEEPPTTNGEPSSKGEKVEGEVTPVKLGVYLLSLHDLNVQGETFGADFWLWADHRNPNFEPLKTLELVNSKSAGIGLQSVEPKGGIFWSQEKIQGTFRHHWDMSNFPFDRHVLTIILEESKYDINQLIYTVNEEENRINNDLSLDGFTIRQMTVTADQKQYDSGFGDPAGESVTNYAQVRIDVEIQRISTILFVKLHIALYAAFLISNMAFLMLSGIPSMMNTINSVVVGTLFATVINLRATDAVIGRSESVTLVDRMHIMTLSHLVALSIVGMTVMMTRKRWSDKGLQRFSYLAASLYFLSYVLWNFIIIRGAAAS